MYIAILRRCGLWYNLR